MRQIEQMYSQSVRVLNTIAPMGDLLIRLWVANVFFQSGLAKLQNWDGTLFLFQSEYQVPLLSPLLAAYAGTTAELVLPVFLALGLVTRFSALGLFVFNIVAVLSYADLMEVGLKDHQHWGLLLLVPLLHGAGKLSLDRLLQRRFAGKPEGAI